MPSCAANIAWEAAKAGGGVARSAGSFVVENPVARKVAMLGLAYFVGQCALIATVGYVALSVFGSFFKDANVFAMMGITDPQTQLIAKLAVVALAAGACLEVATVTMSVAKIALLVGATAFLTSDLCSTKP